MRGASVCRHSIQRSLLPTPSGTFSGALIGVLTQKPRCIPVDIVRVVDLTEVAKE